jgi:hypothetical protein
VHVKRIGGLLLFISIASTALNFLDREFIVLAWIDAWGPETAWAIRFGLAVVGCALWVAGNSAEVTHDDAGETAE